MNIAIIDYESGNISSVINSFKSVSKKTNSDIKIEVTSDLKKISNSDKVILPGQGSFKECMTSLLKINNLRETLEDFVITKKKPLFGICVGMQMFADVGLEEEETKGFGWIGGKVSKIDNKNNKFKLPHMGWNEISIKKKSNLFKNINDKSHMYFVHSFEFVPNEEQYVTSTINYSKEIVSSLEKNNIFGTQFHPEKSDKDGLKIIENFITL
jgi:imidazole glycerol-phosphate synthase subunit HisH